MSEEKRQRVFAATLSGVIMLIAIFAAIIVYQMYGIFARKARIEKLDAEIAALEKEIENIDSQTEAYKFLIEKEKAQLERNSKNDE